MPASKTKSAKKKSVSDPVELDARQAAVQQAEPSPVAQQDVVVVKRSRDLEDYLGAAAYAFKLTPIAFLVTALFGMALGLGVASLVSGSSGERVGASLPSSAASYAALSNSGLRQSALSLVSQMRGFLVEWAVDASKSDFEEKISAAPSASEQQVAWQGYLAESQTSTREWADKFAKEFAPKARLVRAELSTRLSLSDSAENLDQLYLSAADPIEVREVMENLARLAESLLVD